MVRAMEEKAASVDDVLYRSGRRKYMRVTTTSAWAERPCSTAYGDERRRSDISCRRDKLGCFFWYIFLPFVEMFKGGGRFLFG